MSHKRRPISQTYLPSSYISSGLSYAPIFSQTVFAPTSIPKTHHVKYLTLDPKTCVHLPAVCRHLNVIVVQDILYVTVSVDWSFSQFIGVLSQILTKP
ncbi:hypothetical protein CGMCC3_g14492 [Colletotrichum fructicola]|nr:uncharacterized protein CGMCC3_g14492 [Colletotrichum fructicola]KAE9569373.1 hypothetical protein CGMCC3_g14492 [Colletotrichum fructicola]